MVPGTRRGLPPPRPVVTATYCLPSTANVIGNPCTYVASRVCHRILPVRASTALNVRSRSPTKATPPAVEITDVRNGVRCWIDQSSFMLLTSYAASLPMLPSVPRSEEHTSELQSPC